jgi:hypothetical protein
VTTFTGSIPTIASGDTTTVPTNLATYRDALKAASEAWTAYTPTWTGTTTNPAIGDGTLVGAYARVNKLIHCRINLTMGGTTTYGSGNWIFALPVATHAGYGGINSHLAGGVAIDVSVPTVAPLIAIGVTSTTVVGVTTTAGAFLGSGTFAWASGDKVSFSLTYEAA